MCEMTSMRITIPFNGKRLPANHMEQAPSKLNISLTNPHVKGDEPRNLSLYIHKFSQTFVSRIKDIDSFQPHYLGLLKRSLFVGLIKQKC
jgi:hypothetical protein